MFRSCLIILLSLVGFYLQAQEIVPSPIRVQRDERRVPKEEYTLNTQLSTIAAGSNISVFPAPVPPETSCISGNYYVGFQLAFDLANNNTQGVWRVDLQVALLNGSDTLWKKPMMVRPGDQTFVSTIFHNALLTCNSSYKLHIKTKTLTGSVPQANIRLKRMLFKEFEDVFIKSTPIELSCTPSSGKNTLGWRVEDGDGEIDNSGILEYDVEWVYVESHETFLGNAQQAFAFKEPVRVTVATANYIHPIYYPTGRVWYRVRAIGYNPEFPEHHILGDWFYSTSMAIANHNADHTWQSQTIFAEEGKSKKIMSYYDGTLRQRQVLTNLSTENITLVGEVGYDYEGRKAIDILPVPGADASLTFKPGFNVFEVKDATVGTENKAKFHYDNANRENSIISTASGAGKYYSSVNTSTSVLKDFIPDAEGYVFSQTEYLNDGTGRITRQSGVGKEFATDGTHTTRNYYGSASPAELARLFGSNAGKASHYKKNLVLDPNGQVSISYLDQEDRVIATALAGAKPDNVEPLPSFEAIVVGEVTESLNPKNQLANGISVTSHKIMNVAVTEYTFTYDLSALAASLDSEQCVDCAYDLKITITDPDGKLLDLSSAEGDQLTIERSITAQDCNTPETLGTVQFAINFVEIGDYTVTKTLAPKELTFETLSQMVEQTQSVQTLINEITIAYEQEPDNCEICTTCPADEYIEDAITGVAEMDCENILRIIIQDIKSDSLAIDSLYAREPTLDEIEQHPSHCEYLLCLKNKPSDVFEKQLARVGNWSAAASQGYLSLLNIDPFFNNVQLSGASHKSQMFSLLEDIYVTKIDGNELRGSLFEITDPIDTDFYVNEAGEHDAVNGFHILYFDLMAKGHGENSPKIDELRWELFKSFYLEAKRKIKLTIPEYVDCDSAYEKLQMQDGLPLTPEGIATYGDEEGMTGDVLEAEVLSSLYNIENTCGITLDSLDRNTVSTRLYSYFNNHPQNMFRLIILSDLTTDPDLLAIQNVLTSKGCALDSVALVDPLTCARDTTVTYSRYAQVAAEFELLRAAEAARTSEFSGDSVNKRYNEIQSYKDIVQEKLDQWTEAEMDIIRKNIYADFPSDQAVNNGKLSKNQTSMVTTMSLPILDAAEYFALMALYNNTNGPGWSNKTGWATANPLVVQDVRGWHGVTVNANGHVTELNLPSNNLVGTIPSSMEDLPYLIGLNLSYNQLSGTIPSTLGNLSNLEVINFNVNQLSGTLPTTLGNLNNLKYLRILANQLNGSLPASLGGITGLIVLELHNNQFTGTIPTQYGNLNALRELSLHTNQLSGNIPSTLGNMSSLVGLNLSYNSFSGSIPATLGNLSNLEVINFNVNQLSGSIPTALGNLANLKYLRILSNQLTGSLPSSFGGLTALIVLELNNNQLTGSIPVSFGNLTVLRDLSLHTNQLSGSIPSEIGGMTGLVGLNLSYNQLSGALPATLGNLTNLESLILDTNQLTGSIPVSLGNLAKLVYLRVHSNQLSGAIPNTVGGLHAIRIIELQNNQLSGAVPSQMGTLTTLTNLHLQGNNLNGDVPAGLSLLPNIQIIDISANNLTFSDFINLKKSIVGSTFTYIIQDSVDSKKNLYATPTKPYTLSASVDRATNPASKYQWFKNGVSLGAPSENGHTLVLPNVSTANEGTYYYRITNPEAPLLTLTSRPQFLITNDSLVSFTYCLQYDSMNTTLNKFRVKLDWNKVVEQCMANAAKEDSILISYAKSRVIDEHVTTLFNSQTTRCLTNATENFRYAYQPKEYHYTLYYYDQAGNLVQTVPPKGVDTQNQNHTLLTRYRYNSINQLVWQNTPDAGTSEFWYDDKGQLRLSRNAQQTKDNKYSYTQYDEQGRVVQVGELYTSENIASLQTKLETQNFPEQEFYTVKDVTKTFYDFTNAGLQAQFPQTFLRNRVSWVEVHENVKNNNPELLTNGSFTGSLAGWTQTGSSSFAWQWATSTDGGMANLTLNGDVDSKSLGQNIGPIAQGEILNISVRYDIDNGAIPNALKIAFSTAPGSVVQETIISKDELIGSYEKHLTVTATTAFSYIEIIANSADEIYFLYDISIKKADNVNATYYSYDVHGNVKSLLQRAQGIDDKRTDYRYDLVSGKVNYVLYQYGQPDEFIHKYAYDADNRIKEVFTSNDGFLFDRRALYQYYQHGPLARVVLGEYTGAQGLDYYYTLQGWIKGVNMPFKDDLSNDGYTPSKVGRDVFAYALGYYEGDYKPRNATKTTSSTRDLLWERYADTYGVNRKGYYNGNIAWMETDLKKIGQQKGARVKGVQAMLYRYDQLHRIRQSRSLTAFVASPTVVTGFSARAGSTAAYDEDFTYDPNGNLLTLQRLDNNAAVADQFNYRYYNNTNRLQYVNDFERDTTYEGNIVSDNKIYNRIRIAATANVAEGQYPTIKAIDSVMFRTGFDFNNLAKGLRAYVLGDDEGEFNYDAIGNLIWDQNKGVRITWTPYGKVRNVYKANGDSIVFRYDASGNRIQKRTITNGVENTTFYVRDASGNVMSTYHQGSDLPVSWTAPVGVTITGNTVTKPSGTTGWNAGASSIEVLPAGVDGYIEVPVTSLTGTRMIGFNDADVNTSYTEINYAIYLNGNALLVYENGTQKISLGGSSLALNNVIRIERIGTTIYYRKNGILFYTSLTPSTTKLVVDISMAALNSSFTNVTYRFGDAMVATEQPIYGSSRLGIYRGHREAGVRKLGTARFELSNHLGNVLSVITDNIRLQADSAWADVVNSTDYYAFGSEMPTRTYSANADYRYGFNGKEQDTDNTWGDDIYDYGFRIYNPKIGKFLSVDPLTREYPWYTPYQFSGNKPIAAIDLDGLEEQIAIDGSVHHGPHNMRIINESIIRKRQEINDRVLTTQHINPPKDIPVISTNPFANELPSVAKARMNSATWQEGYNQFIKNGKIMDPFVFGGGEFGFGFAETTAEGFRQAPGVILPELALGRVAQLSRVTKIVQLAEANAARQLIRMESTIKGAHFVSRHGASTTLEQQFVRSVSGLTPDGVKGVAVDASRFLSDQLELQAAQRAQTIYAQTGKSSFTFNMSTPIGEGYLKGGQTYIRTTNVQAVFRKGELITLFPKLK